jgi:hypothetical protein
MANNNDAKILLLKQQIEEKKIKLGKSQKFTPLTNCSIEFDGVRTNIQTFNNKEQVINMLVKLNSLAMSAKELELLNEYKISGYSVIDWITDLKAKLDFMGRKEEEQKLKAMEATLDKLLSDEKKVELELDAIAASLKE